MRQNLTKCAACRVLQGGKVKQKTVEKLGYLDELEKLYPDPIAHFKALAKERTRESEYMISIIYVKNIKFVKGTGEVAEGLHLFIDLEKVAAEQQYDGYYSIVTSEKHLSDKELRDAYRKIITVDLGLI